jgi:hypothetical protein
MILNSKTKFIYTLIILVGFFSACKRETSNNLGVISTVDLSQKSLIKIVNLTTGAARNFAYSPELYSPASGAAFAYGATFPAGFNYFAIRSGDNNIVIKDTLSTSTQIPLTIAGWYEPGKRYSIFTYDTITSIRYKMVNDDIVVPADTSARIRFANFIRSGSTLPNFDLYSKNLGANVFSNVAATDVTAFRAYSSKVQDSIFLRETGTTINILGTSVTPEQRRSYTLVFRGRYDATGVSPTVPRTLTLFTNY